MIGHDGHRGPARRARPRPVSDASGALIAFGVVIGLFFYAMLDAYVL
jgi:hypothetical protein